MSPITPYTCYRCKYTSKDKRHMRIHLNERKKLCPAVSLDTDVELTEEIKNKILANRVYFPPPKVTLKSLAPVKTIGIESIIEDVNEIHYIYLLRTKENAKQNVNVYKFGRTVDKKATGRIKRLESYGKGTEPILVKTCINSAYCEKEIKRIFTEKFDKYVFGTEYFIGDVDDMCEVIWNVIKMERIGTKKLISENNLNIENNKSDENNENNENNENQIIKV